MDCLSSLSKSEVGTSHVLNVFVHTDNLQILYSLSSVCSAASRAMKKLAEVNESKYRCRRSK